MGSIAGGAQAPQGVADQGGRGILTCRDLRIDFGRGWTKSIMSNPTRLTHAVIINSDFKDQPVLDKTLFNEKIIQAQATLGMVLKTEHALSTFKKQIAGETILKAYQCYRAKKRCSHFRQERKAAVEKGAPKLMSKLAKEKAYGEIASLATQIERGYYH